MKITRSHLRGKLTATLLCTGVIGLAALFVAGGSRSDGGERFLRSGTGLPLVVIGMVAATVVAIAVAGLFLVDARGIRDDGSSDRDPPRSQVETIGEGKAGDDKAGAKKSADQPAELEPARTELMEDLRWTS